MADILSYNEIHVEIQRQPDGTYIASLKIINPLYGPVSGGCDRSIFFDNHGQLEWIPSGPDQKDGQRLFEWLFKDEKLKAAWNQVRGMHPQRRIRLLWDPGAPEIDSLPWELLPESSSAGALTLSITSASPFSRYLPGTWDPVNLIEERPISILAVIANPENLKADYDLDPVPVDTIWPRLQQAVALLEEAHQVKLVQLPEPCSLTSLREELKKGYHILHFTGHGAFNPKNGAVLYMAGEKNQVETVNSHDFAVMLANQFNNVEKADCPALRLVTLASCQTSQSGFSDTFGGFAQTLISYGIPAALAMRDLIDQDTAGVFMNAFFRGLLHHGLLDLSCNEARNAVLSAGLSGAFIPVLYSRLTNNQLVQPVAFQMPKARLPYEPEMVRIPSGKFIMGANPSDPEAEIWEKTDGILEIDLPDFWIGKYPVTNGEYCEFVQQKGYPAPKLNWEGSQPRPDKIKHPVAGVSWEDAQAYCTWLSAQTGRNYHLPTESEWEKAARGDKDQRIYPWGNQWQDGRCHIIPPSPDYPDVQPGFSTAPVNQYQPAQSPYGCFDMVGNVREWTTTIWGDHLSPDKNRFPYPWKPDAREKPETSQRYFKTYRIQRGGGASDSRSQMRCSARDWDELAATYMCGFRVVREC